MVDSSLQGASRTASLAGLELQETLERQDLSSPDNHKGGKGST